ncbi:AbiH family protein [Acholeplasma laidlawii]|uniref:Bacteriophage abortive infection AbiH n=2 Tax=Acholeplasma laidlawii TaxID=2148 RepID=A9NH36_ACHLI|nr:AbiH family protein [Acholeplasma laidlawii]ABX81666.1 hypothetical protein ACL_1056 [Acholeplasma laidlawii PG-8A]NWH11148.1 hypothetical protein [Acholeplasma laidlawii]NWH13441.1 hypothetical protein [Acholeplasma laidlawii]NWH14580.1 hypothetical protein [Acholeplasma laidlawii]OAN19669.1 hypothetical protein A2I99_04545 [Acholeplasma laidlawii]
MLLVLGNGFDIQCGLKTDYLDYFNQRYSKEDFQITIDYFNQIQSKMDYDNSLNLNNSIYRIINRMTESDINLLFDQISIWDVVFISEKIVKKNAGWHNVENLIFEYISENKISLIDIQKQGKNYSSLVRTFNPLFALISKAFELKEMTFSQIEYNKWLLDQLKIIELDFKEYVSNQLRLNKIKYERRNSLLYKEFSKIASSVNDSIFSLINFNYSIPTFTRNYDDIKQWNMTNIHGSIHSEEVIFGIDEQDLESKKWIKSNESKYLFTKTARKIHAYDGDESFNLKEAVKGHILIYGHSLNPQDYSYFQSIFDACNLIESTTIIYFAWSNFDKKRKVRTDTVNNAIKLLKNYGESIPNAVGNNLLHRMLLEKRIRIIEITNINDVKSGYYFYNYKD